ncbi:MAG: niacin transporter [Bacillota bacterium]|jgi:niacin transporter|nr:niacin transporter [Bacillota bacterium]MDK2855014.1 niacin transporter [Bacillota bacterium]MDK2924864.1 niacin transporter [Bacillota bacterium]
MRVRDIIYGALLTGLSLLIPLAFGNYLRVYLPPFSATLASHVPVMLAMLVSPAAAMLVGAGSAVGFLMVMGPVIAARAAVHMLFGLAGALLIKQGRSFRTALLASAPIHALGEALVVLPFGFTSYEALVLVGIGTLLHHAADAVISLAVASSLRLSSFLHARARQV